MRLNSVIAVAWLVAACGSAGVPGTSAPTGAPPTAAAATATPTQTPTPTPSPTPTPTSTPTPTPTPTPPPTPPPTPTPTPPPTPTPAPTRTLRPGETAAPTPINLAPFLTAEVTVVNLAAAALSVTVTILDPESTDEYEVATLEVQPLQVTAQSVLQSRYRLDFDYPGGRAADAGSCVIDIADGEAVQFAVVEEGAVITAGEEPEDPGELVVATSARCRAGADS